MKAPWHDLRHHLGADFRPDLYTVMALWLVVWYYAIHFGRPLGEAFSSVFGGYLLGALALCPRSIGGGLLILIGIAWGMEIAAFLQPH